MFLSILTHLFELARLPKKRYAAGVNTPSFYRFRSIFSEVQIKPAPCSFEAYVLITHFFISKAVPVHSFVSV